MIKSVSLTTNKKNHHDTKQDLPVFKQKDKINLFKNHEKTLQKHHFRSYKNV